jgi:hypothetical protein
VDSGGGTVKGLTDSSTLTPAELRAHIVTPLEATNRVLDELDEVERHGPRLIETGIPYLDRDITIAPRTVTAILGRPSQGKSTWLKAIVKRTCASILARQLETAGDGDTDTQPFIAFVTLEEPDVKLQVQLGGLPFQWRQVKRGEIPNSPENRLAIMQTVKATSPLRYIAHPGAIGSRIIVPLSAATVMRIIEEAVDEFGRVPALIVMDYLQRLHGEGASYSEASKSEQVAEASAGAALMARAYKVPVLIAVQASRETDKRGSEIPMPGMRDAQHSSAIEQDCDNMIGIVRPMALEDVRQAVDTVGFAELTFGGREYRLDRHTGQSLYFLSCVKSRDDDAIGRRYTCHISPDDLSVYATDWRTE